MPGTIVKRIFSVPAAEKKNHYYPPLAVLLYLSLVAVVVIAINDFTLRRREAAIDTNGVVSLIAATTAGRFKPKNTPAYCTPNTEFDPEDPFLQAILGRLCLKNVTCDQWFGDSEIFNSNENQWTLTTTFNGVPYPRNVPNPDDFDVTPIMNPAFFALNKTGRKAVLATIFGDALKYTCTPSYVVEDPEAVTIAILPTVSAPRFRNGQKVLPKLRVFGLNGSIVVDTPPVGQPLTIRFRDLFNIDLEAPAYIQNVPLPQIVPAPLMPKVPNGTVRQLGLQARLDVRCTNYEATAYGNDGTKLLDDIICNLIPSIVNESMAFLPETVKLITNDGINFQPMPFGANGILITIAHSLEIRYVDWYYGLTWGVSIVVILDKVNGIFGITAEGIAVVGGLLWRKCCGGDSSGDTADGNGAGSSKDGTTSGEEPATVVLATKYDDNDSHLKDSTAPGEEENQAWARSGGGEGEGEQLTSVESI